MRDNVAFIGRYFEIANRTDEESDKPAAANGSRVFGGIVQIAGTRS